MKKTILAIWVILSTLVVQAQITHSSYVPTGYQLVFNDEFDDPATKLVNWKPDNRDGRGQEWLDGYGAIEDGCMKLKNTLLQPTND